MGLKTLIIVAFTLPGLALAQSKPRPKPAPKRPPPLPRHCDEVTCLIEPNLPCCKKFRPKSPAGSPRWSGRERLSRSDVFTTIRRAKPMIQRCLRKASGVYKVKLRVNASGRVSSAKLTRAAQTKATRCLLRTVKRLRFPHSRRGVSFTYPFKGGGRTTSVVKPTSVLEPARTPAPATTEAMVGISGGCFSAGPPAASRNVCVQGFELDVYEVTLERYRRQCPKRAKCAKGYAASPKHPVTGVDYHSAIAFCKSIGRRLPTADEWEYAARSTSAREFPWGNAAPTSRARGPNATEASPAGTHPADRSPYGVYDMAGNVMEWVQSAGALVTVRGGHFASPSAQEMKTWWSYRMPPSPNAAVGFRCARSQPARTKSAKP
jgi:formylglycine-generating enzyme required for sulfatase activity